MILYPAIDVLDGRVVRLAKGDFNAVTDYGGDPLAVAQAWRAAGADWLHLVDLSGARAGAGARPAWLLPWWRRACRYRPAAACARLKTWRRCWTPGHRVWWWAAWRSAIRRP